MRRPAGGIAWVELTRSKYFGILSWWVFLRPLPGHFTGTIGPLILNDNQTTYEDESKGITR